ncbi:MAG: HEPN domain-containing protein [Deltaproteobacteria bacterium]|nr:HEPN domain-containing protein [Deltaproteobacteria bacterium]
MNNKASKTLDAANNLLNAHYIDSAASRFYYAAYQAAIYCLEKKGRQFSEFSIDAVYWEHGIIINNASLLRGKGKDDKVFLKSLFDLRVQADYNVIPVKEIEVRESVKGIKEFVKDLIG